VKILGARLLISIAKTGARGAKSGICSYINILKTIIKGGGGGGRWENEHGGVNEVCWRTGKGNWPTNVNNGRASGTAMKVLFRKREHTDTPA
jgi:hypothetical protein